MPAERDGVKTGRVKGHTLLYVETRMFTHNTKHVFHIHSLQTCKQVNVT